MYRKIGRLGVVIAFAGVLGSIANAQELQGCGSLSNGYGPYDYYTDKDKLPIVDNAHFTSDVESLIHRHGKNLLGAELDYTLRAFPNHPRALSAMIRLGEKIQSERPQGALHSVYCYLERAVRFRPNDGMARVLMAVYLVKKKRFAEAEPHAQHAAEHADGSGNIHYNLGLVYLDMKDYPKALTHAHIAYANGFNLPGLRKRLKDAGAWQDPVPASTAPPSADPPDNQRDKPQ